MLDIKDLHASVEEKDVLKGLNLNVKAGEVHAIMGPNGAGKSSLSKIIAGHPAYEVTKGSLDYEVNFKKKIFLEMEPEERARAGVFLAFPISDRNTRSSKPRILKNIIQRDLS